MTDKEIRQCAEDYANEYCCDGDLSRAVQLSYRAGYVRAVSEYTPILQELIRINERTNALTAEDYEVFYKEWDAMIMKAEKLLDDTAV